MSAKLFVPLLAAVALLALPATSPAVTENSFHEETAEANWAVTHTCADGSTVEARLLVRTTYDFEAPATADSDPTARVQYQAVCPDGRSFSWGNGAIPITYSSTPNLKSVTASGTGTVRDTSGVTHTVSFDVSWTGTGPLTTEVGANQGFTVGTSSRKQRAATATGTFTFDGRTLASGPANHRITPFIRLDEERSVEPGN